MEKTVCIDMTVAELKERLNSAQNDNDYVHLKGQEVAKSDRCSKTKKNRSEITTFQVNSINVIG